MKMEWIGHSCFRMTAADGTVAVTDPYDDSVGIRMIPLEADLVTMSHDHHDHNNTGMLRKAPVIVRGLQEACVGGFRTRAVESWHDDAKGARRGCNAIRLFDAEGLKIVHMGDQGCMPDEEILSVIRNADVMMIPVGGFYTVDAHQASEIIRATKPRCVIPMHVKTMRCTYPIETVRPFLAVMNAQDAQPVDSLELSPQAVPQGVVLMRPMADEI